MGKNLCSTMLRTLAAASVTILALVVVPKLSAAPGIVTLSGQSLPSLFDGLNPVRSRQSWELARIRPAPRPWNGTLRSRLPGFMPVVIFGGGNCPGWEECSGSYTILEPAPGGCDVGDGEDCPIYNFTNDPGAECPAGEAQAYCGEFCCVSAEPCTNPRIVCP